MYTPTNKTSEKEVYYELLQNCVKAFNIIPNSKIYLPDAKDTYTLVSQIERTLKKYDKGRTQCQ